MRRNDYYAKGGTVAPTHVKKELAFMKAKGAPAGMVKAEKKEHGLPTGAKSKGKFSFADGGVTEGPNANIDDDTRARAMEFVRKRMAEQAAPTVRVPPIRRRPAPPEVSAATDEDASDRRMRRAVAQNEDASDRRMRRAVAQNYGNEGRGKPAPPVSSDDDASDRRMARAAAQNYGNEGRDKSTFADGGMPAASWMANRPSAAAPGMVQPKMGVPMNPQAAMQARPQVGSFNPGMARAGGQPPTQQAAQAGMQAQQAMQARQQAAQAGMAQANAQAAQQARPMPQQAMQAQQARPMPQQAPQPMQPMQARQQAPQAMPARPGLQGMAQPKAGVPMAKGGCVKDR